MQWSTTVKEDTNKSKVAKVYSQMTNQGGLLQARWIKLNKSNDE